MKTHIDLFSGIGGFALAAQWAGYTTVQFCEIEPFCHKVLNKNFPGVPIHDDITTFDGRSFRGNIDLLTGGFPCQDISVAGKGKGITGARSGLFFELYRIINEVRPARFVLENSPALRTRGADTVLPLLGEAGYTCWPLVVGADDVGAPHRRKRVWIVGVEHSQGNEDNIGKTGIVRPTQAGWQGPHNAAGNASVELADAMRKGLQGQPRSLSNRYQSGRDNSGPNRQASNIGCANGFPPGPDADWSSIDYQYWPVELEVCERPDGLPRKLVRPGIGRRNQILKALGNAIVPQVAYAIIKAAENIEA